MKKLLLCIMGALLLHGFAGCSNDDDDQQSYAEIVGTWELVAYYIPESVRVIPADERDIYVFNQNGKVTVTKKWASYYQKGPDLHNFPNEDGEYEYSYDKEEHIIHFLGKARKCIISSGEMRMEGYYTGPADGVEHLQFIFIRKQN